MALLAVLVSGHAWASEARLQGPIVDRGEARAMAAVAGRAGYRARVLRVTDVALGRRYMLVVDGVGSGPKARAAAEDLARQLGRGLRLYDVRSASMAPAPPSAVPELAPSVPDRTRDVRVAMAELESALGRDRRWSFSFARTLGDGTVVEHRLVSRPGALAVEIAGTDVPGSRIVVADGQAWVESSAGVVDRRPEDVDRAIVDLLPAAVLAPVYRGLASQDEVPRHEDGVVEIGGLRLRRLVTARGPQGDGRVVWVEPTTGLPHRIEVIEAGSHLRIDLDDYRDVGDASVPHHVIVRQDAVVVDEIVVHELILEPRIHESSFRRPGSG